MRRTSGLDTVRRPNARLAVHRAHTTPSGVAQTREGRIDFFFSFSSFFLSFSFGSSYLVQRRRRRCLTGDGHPASSQSRARDVGRARQTGSDRGGRVTECIHPPCPSCWNHLFMGGRKESRGKSKNSRIQKMN